MKVQEVILQAMAKRITWWPAAEILGMTERSLRRWRWRWQQYGCDRLFDRRRGRPSPRRVPVESVEEVLKLYQDRYA
jgi:transposase